MRKLKRIKRELGKYYQSTSDAQTEEEELGMESNGMNVVSSLMYSTGS